MRLGFMRRNSTASSASGSASFAAGPPVAAARSESSWRRSAPLSGWRRHRSFLHRGLFPGCDAPDARRERPGDEGRAGRDTRVETRPEELPQHVSLVTAIPLDETREAPPRTGYDCSPALLAQLVEHLHGKEGVDGSSPSEGFVELPANRAVVLSIP